MRFSTHFNGHHDPKFYVSEGWTRKKVSELLLSGNINKVIPRYNNLQKDASIPVNHRHVVCPRFRNEDFNDCLYFTVLCQNEKLKSESKENNQFSYEGIVLNENAATILKTCSGIR